MTSHGDHKVDPRSTNAVDKHIGARMRSRRKEIGMSQESVAKELGVTFQQIQKYENGINRISARTLWNLTRVLDIDYAALLPRRAKGPAELTTSVLDTAEFAELAAVFANLNDHGRRITTSIARSLASDPDLAAPAGKKSPKK